MHPVAKALNLIRAEINSVFMERDEVIEAMLLAILAKEHAFILGPPGTGKSALTREVFSRFDGSVYFEQLLSKTRPAEAILGPYDVPLFRTQGDFKRKINGFLPTANFGFLDELGKMGPTLGHDLLAVLNERILHQVNGTRSSIDLPLYSIVGAANEEIVQESEDAHALWDRLIVRVTVNYIQDASNFRALLRKRRTVQTSRTTIDFAELAAAIDNDVPLIDLPDDVLDMVDELKDKLHKLGMIRSDRRWEDITKLLQASAFLAGRTVADESDVQALRFALWDTSTEIQKVNAAVLSIGSPVTAKCAELISDLEGMRAGVRALKGRNMVDVSNYALEVSEKIADVRSDLSDLRNRYPNQGEAKITTVLDLCTTVFNEAKNASLKQIF